MTDVQKPVKQRLLSLDVFRGITIAGMILVNNPGSWKHMYAPLGHAHWNGWTPTDLIFPFFLFIVGVAMAFSFSKRLEQTGSFAALMPQIVRRTAIIFMLGLILAGFPDFRLIGPYILGIAGIGGLLGDSPLVGFGNVKWGRRIGALLLVMAVVFFIFDFGHFQETNLRILGVLQRIALCYFVTSLIIMLFGPSGRAVVIVLLLGGYWFVCNHCSAPDGFEANVVDSSGLLHEWIDRAVLGDHLYKYESPEPEGIISTFPAIATCLIGVFVGQWLRSRREENEKVALLFIVANVALFVGMCMDHSTPINKKLWTSSYVVFTAGMAMHFLAMCYWLIDVKGFRRWAWPFVVFGTNAIAVYVAAGMGARLLSRYHVDVPGGDPITVKNWIFETLYLSWADPVNASLGYALTFVACALLLLVPLHIKRIIIKV